MAGAAGRMDQALNSNAANGVEKFKRGVMTNLGAVGGSLATFAMEHTTGVTVLGYTFAGLAVTVLTVKAAMATYAAISAIVSGAHAIMSASAWTVMGNWLRMMGIGLMAYARIAGAAVVSAATTAGAWLGSALVSIGTWIAAVVRAGDEGEHHTYRDHQLGHAVARQ